jgi:hypothetical protein
VKARWRPLGIHIGGKINIKMDLGGIGRGVMDPMHLAQDRDQWRALVNTVMNLRIPKNAGKFLSS